MDILELKSRFELTEKRILEDKLIYVIQSEKLHKKSIRICIREKRKKGKNEHIFKKVKFD